MEKLPFPAKLFGWATFQAQYKQLWCVYDYHFERLKAPLVHLMSLKVAKAFHVPGYSICPTFLGDVLLQIHVRLSKFNIRYPGRNLTALNSVTITSLVISQIEIHSKSPHVLNYK